MRLHRQIAEMRKRLYLFSETFDQHKTSAVQPSFAGEKARSVATASTPLPPAHV